MYYNEETCWLLPLPNDQALKMLGETMWIPAPQKAAVEYCSPMRPECTGVERKPNTNKQKQNKEIKTATIDLFLIVCVLGAGVCL